MFDGLRGDPSDSSGFDDQPAENFFEDLSSAPTSGARPGASPKRKRSGKFLGLNEKQRFILAIMLMFAVCMLGTMCLFLTHRFMPR